MASIEKLRKVLDSKNHLDRLKMDLNLAKKLLFKTVNAQKKILNGSAHIQY